MIKQSPNAAGLRAAIGADDPVTLVEVLGARLAVRRWGAGPQILCLHAAGHGAGDFAGLAARLAGRFEVIAVDWPGQGRSPADGAPVRAERYADLLLALCEALRLQRPALVGNSIGGAAALSAVARAPERFSALVLCNPGGLAHLDAFANFAVGRMAAFFRAGARGAAWFPAAFAAYYRWIVLPAPAARDQRRRIIAAGRELAPVLAEAWAGFAEPSADIRALPARVTLPVWLAWARGDAFVAWSRSKAAALRFPDHQLTLFPGGHAPFLEAPDAFAEGLAAFLDAAVPTLTR